MTTGRPRVVPDRRDFSVVLDATDVAHIEDVQYEMQQQSAKKISRNEALRRIIREHRERWQQKEVGA